MDKINEKNTYIKIFWISILGSLIGTFYEEIVHLVKTGSFEVRSSVIYGPFNIEYGVGLALYVIFLGKNNSTRKWYLTFLYCFLIGGITEYLTSYFLEKFYNMQFWNYNDRLLNIDGRTTVIYSAFWGLIGLILMKWGYPKYEKFISKISNKYINIATVILTILMIINFLITSTALYRYNLRKQKINPRNGIEKFYDKYYNDELIERKFPNMKYLI